MQVSVHIDETKCRVVEFVTQTKYWPLPSEAEGLSDNTDGF